MSYSELWAVMGNWRKEFSSGEFARTFYSPDPNKVLHDMAKKGMLERVGTAKYRVRTEKEYVFGKHNVSRAYSFLSSSELPYALTNVDAVYAWTHGGYNADRFFGFYPVHMRVKKSDLERWKEDLSKRGWKSILAGEKPRETLFGLFFVLYPEERIEAKDVDSLKVDSLEDTVKFCKENVYTFEPALEMLDEEYKLSLGASYRETSTNVMTR
jgi:hypothetical protein